MSEIVINASNVSPDILLWLRKGFDNLNTNYAIERRLNRQYVKSDFFRVSDKFAKELMAMSIEDAWFAMEEFCMNTGC